MKLSEEKRELLKYIADNQGLCNWDVNPSFKYKGSGMRCDRCPFTKPNPYFYCNEMVEKISDDLTLDKIAQTKASQWLYDIAFEEKMEKLLTI